MSTTTATKITVSAYADGDAKTKGKIRADLNKIIMDALGSGDFATAQATKITLDQCLASSKARAPKITVDPKITLANRVATLRAAADMIESGKIIPTGLDLGDDFKIGEVNFTAGVADADAATKIAGAKITRSVERNSIQGALDRAIEGLDSGTFLTCTEVANKGRDGEYRPSPGAVAARVDWDTLETTLEGVTPVSATTTTPRGFVVD